MKKLAFALVLVLCSSMAHAAGNMHRVEAATPGFWAWVISFLEATPTTAPYVIKSDGTIYD